MMSRNLKLFILLIVTATIGSYVVFVIIPTQLAKGSYAMAKTLGQDFRDAFQFTPEIKVNNTIVLNHQTPILEIAVVNQNFEHQYIWINSWLGSTKKIYITGSFNAKAGYDVDQKFSINLRDESAIVSLPEPSVLSVESLGDIEYRDEQGIWNWVDMNDRTKATNAFITDARRYANQAALLQDAKKNMEQKLHELLEPYAASVEVRYTESVKQTK